METIIEMRAIDFWRDVVELVCGKGHGLGVAVYGSPDREAVEVLGELPVSLRRGLRRAVVWDEAHTVRGKRCEQRGEFTWCTNRDGTGPCYAIPSMGAFIGLLDARREALAGGAE